jgi:ParB family chromosome partitioning protein
MSEKRRGLGRGLSALLPGQEEEVRTLPVTQLAPNRYQPRTNFDETGIEELSESIKSQGLIQPIVVTRLKSGSYTIIAGERRWRAAQRAGLTVVPVVERQVRDDRQLLELALVENVQRADLNPVEEAEAYRTLQENFQLSHEEIAARVGRSRAAISNTLRLLKLPPAVLDHLRSGRLTAGQARPLLALADTAKIERLAQRAIENGLSARALETLATGERRGARAKRRKPADPNTAAAADRLTRRLQTRVEIERRGRGGVVKIHYHSEEELMRLFDELDDS